MSVYLLWKVDRGETSLIRVYQYKAQAEHYERNHIGTFAIEEMEVTDEYEYD